MAGCLDMKLIHCDENSLSMTMPIDSRTTQPFQRLHGGASIALAENAASLAGNLIVRSENKICVGLSVYSNHVKSATKGIVTAKASFTHLGRTTQIWKVEIHDEENNLLNLSTITLAVIDKPQ